MSVALFVSSTRADVRGQLLARSVTGADGIFTFADRAGCYIVRASVERGLYSTSSEQDWSNLDREEKICSDIDSGLSPTHIVHRLDGPSIGGRVVDANGAPVASISVNLKSPDNVFIDGTLTDSQGRFRWSVENEACHVIVVSSAEPAIRSFNPYVADGFDERSPNQNNPACPGVDVESVIYDRTARPGRIDGRFVASGSPIEADVEVDLLQRVGDNEIRLATTGTDATGRFEFLTDIECYIIRATLPPGFSFAGHDPRSNILKTQPTVEGVPVCEIAGRHTLGDIEVFAPAQSSPNFVASGRSVDQNGNTVAMTDVDLFTTKTTQAETFVGGPQVDAAGRWSFGIFDGCYVVVTKAPVGWLFENGSQFMESRACANGANIEFPEHRMTKS